MSSSHVHLTVKELERFFSIDPNVESYDDFEFSMMIDEKLEQCDACQVRYALFMDTQQSFGAMSSDLLPLPQTSNIAEIVREKLSEFDEVISEKVNRWLDGAQDTFEWMIGGLSRSPAMGLSGVRGIGEKAEGVAISAADIPIAIDVNSDGSFSFPEDVDLGFEFGNDGEFELNIEHVITIKFSVKAQTDFGTAVCLVITGRDETDFIGMYELKTISKAATNSHSDSITLPPGKYAVYILTV